MQCCELILDEVSKSFLIVRNHNKNDILDVGSVHVSDVAKEIAGKSVKNNQGMH